MESFDLDDCGNFSIVIDQKDLDRAVDLLEAIKETIDARIVSYTPDVAVITGFGPHTSGKSPGSTPSCFPVSRPSASVPWPSAPPSPAFPAWPGENTWIRRWGALTAAFDAPFQVKERPKDY